MLFKTWRLILAKQQCSPAVLQRSSLLFQAHVPALWGGRGSTAGGGGGGSRFPKRGSLLVLGWDVLFLGLAAWLQEPQRIRSECC